MGCSDIWCKNIQAHTERIKIKNVILKYDAIRQKRSEILRNKSEILDIIIEGSKRAREVTKKNLELIKEAMSLNFK